MNCIEMEKTIYDLDYIDDVWRLLAVIQMKTGGTKIILTKRTRDMNRPEETIYDKQHAFVPEDLKNAQEIMKKNAEINWERSVHVTPEKVKKEKPVKPTLTPLQKFEKMDKDSDMYKVGDFIRQNPGKRKLEIMYGVFNVMYSENKEDERVGKALRNLCSQKIIGTDATSDSGTKRMAKYKFIAE